MKEQREYCIQRRNECCNDRDKSVNYTECFKKNENISIIYFVSNYIRQKHIPKTTY